MKKIKYIIFLLLCFSIQSFLFAADYNNQLSMTNGSSVNDLSDGKKYKNSLSVNEGISVNQKSFDYRLNSGLLASIKVSNPDIVFYDFVPASSDTISVANNVNIGVTVHTGAKSIKRVGYKISETPPTDEIGPFTYLYQYQEGQTASTSTVTVSTVVISGFKPGVNYLQWYAQNGANEYGNTTTHIVRIGISTSSSIEILQPTKISSNRPQIQARIYSPFGFNESSVTIRMCVGASTVTVRNVETGEGKFITNEILDYNYTGDILAQGEHTLWIELVDNTGITTSATLTFTVNSNPVADLLPYPSPYNPKKGAMNIRFVIAQQASVTINIYDRAGKLVSQVLNSVFSPAGESKVTWNAKSYAGDSLANGVYICEIIMKSDGKENRRYKSFAILRK
ncbi:MAG: hypothetical protein LBD46_02585 [Endomicrobium sp.]|jgi:hypothetical protein|nr:hypothetical protein [Endomicrobium sp.]